MQLGTRSWRMDRILSWLVKCKGKCSAKPAQLDFDKLAQIALMLQSGMGCMTALILAVLQTPFYLPWMYWGWRQ